MSGFLNFIFPQETQIADAISAFVLFLDSGGQISYANAYTESFFEYSGEELLGKNFFQTLIEDPKGDFSSKLTLDSGFEINAPGRKKNGERCCVSWKNRPVFCGEEPRKGWVCTGFDITPFRSTQQDGNLSPVCDQVEEFLRREDKYHSLFEQSLDAIFILQGEKFIECNLKALQLLKVEGADSLKEKKIWDFAPEQQPQGKGSREYFLELMQKSLEGIDRTIEWRMKREDDSELDCSLSLSPLLDGKDRFFQVILRDISEQKRAAFTLELYRAYLSVLAEMRKLFYGRTEEEIYQAFLTSVVNHFGFCKAWIGQIENNELKPMLHAGYKKKHVDVMSVPVEVREGEIAFPLSTAVESGSIQIVDDLQSSPAFTPWLDFALQSDSRAMFAVPFEINGITQGGIVFYSSVPGIFDRSVVDYLDEVVRELGRIISEKRFWERQKADLKKAKEHAESNASSRSRFLATMSHEIRTPMTAILGYSEVFSDRESTGEVMREAGAVIRNNAQYLLNILNDILDISKIEANQLNVEIQDFRIDLLIAEVFALFSSETRSRGIELKIKCKTKVPKIIRTDRYRLEQVLLNLIGNAIKFTGKGEIAIEISWEPEGKHATYMDRIAARNRDAGQNAADLVFSSASPPGSKNGKLNLPAEKKRKSVNGLLCVSVRDSGIGIPQEKLEVIFQPYKQADSTTEKKYGGTGLGLPICRTLIEILGGSLTVSSEKGIGSTFTIRLEQHFKGEPQWIDSGFLGEEEQNEPGKPQPTPTKSNRILDGLRLLIAEDSRDSRRLFHMILTKAGAEVDMVENGEDAITKAWENWETNTPYDIILMDMQMPVRDGYSAVQELRSRNYTAPIVALTAHAMLEEKEKCLQVGCNDCATKPILRAELIDKILTNIPPRNSGKDCESESESS